MLPNDIWFGNIQTGHNLDIIRYLTEGTHSADCRNIKEKKSLPKLLLLRNTALCIGTDKSNKISTDENNENIKEFSHTLCHLCISLDDLKLVLETKLQSHSSH